jgi:acetate kinase
MDALSILRSVPVLSDFDRDSLERMAAASWTGEYSSQSVILRKGHAVDTVGIIVSGTVEIQRPASPSEKDPVILSEGQLFGEISLLTGEPASADVVAASGCRILHVPHSALSLEMGRTPKASQRLAKLLADRLTQRKESWREEATRADFKSRDLVLGGDFDQPVLVLSTNVSSIKYALFQTGVRKVVGRVDGLETGTPALTHHGPHGSLQQKIPGTGVEEAVSAIFQFLVHPEVGAIERPESLGAVGHRIAHGGAKFTTSTLVNEETKKELRRISNLAPLHNPVQLQGIECCEKHLGSSVPQVCVFDTAFHMTMPEHAYRYALPKALADRHSLRRFGFHGLSHKYLSQVACESLGEPPDSLRVITCHLGSGASVAAVDHGRSVDTSMGLTPLEGLVMGTRSGDLDPGLVLALMDLGHTRVEIGQILNEKSGLLGLSGISKEMAELEKAAEAGHVGALLAIQVFCYRVKKYIGAYAAAMGGLDALVFAGGIGEKHAGVRSRICHGLTFLGIELDRQRNQGSWPAGALSHKISTDGANVSVWVVPVDEEGMLAAATIRALKRSGVAEVLSCRRDRKIPIGISAHHVHLSQDHVERLFGAGHQLTPRNPLSQPGQFACEEAVDLIGPKGRVDRVRVLGPVRPSSQVEISRTEEYKLGIDAPIRASGDLKGSPGITLVGSKGEEKLTEGVICALRHIHMSPHDALTYGLKDRDIVRVQVGGERSLIFGDVLIRVHPDFKLEMHIDTDEANAAEINPDMIAVIESIQRRGN